MGTKPKQFDELWKKLDQLLSVDKNARTRAEADDIRFHLKTLVTSPDGRRSIVERLQSKGPFPGKERFLRELARSLDEFRPSETETAAVERRELLRIGVSRSSGRKIEGHWDLLWLLIDSDDPDSAPIALASLTKVMTKKQSDLRDSLACLDAWLQTRPDRGVAILEAVQINAPPEFVQRLDRALAWQKERAHVRAVNQSEHSHPRETIGVPLSSETGSKLGAMVDAKGAPATSVQSIPTEEKLLAPVGTGTLDFPSANDTDSSSGRVIPNSGEPVAKRGRSVTTRNDDKNLDPLEVCISEVSRVIKSCFRNYTQRTNTANEGRTQNHQEIVLLGRKCEQLVEELKSVRSELDQEIENCKEGAKRVTELEHEVSLRKDELRASRDEVSNLTEALASARQEVKQAHDRADDDIHQVKLERDHAIRTFQSELWDRLKLCLAEVLNDDDVNTSPTSDEHFFRRRLREIRAALHEMQVPPY